MHHGDNPCIYDLLTHSIVLIALHLVLTYNYLIYYYFTPLYQICQEKFGFLVNFYYFFYTYKLLQNTSIDNN